MNFAELRFWGYLLAGLAVVFGVRMLGGRSEMVRSGRYDKAALALLSLSLLLAVSAKTFIIFCVVALSTYVGLVWIQKRHSQHALKYLALLIPLQLAPLIYYKYAGFIVMQVAGAQSDYFRDLVIPIGISFYTFQKLAFVVDTLVFKHPCPRFLDYLNFVSFFPQIVAGPIERRSDLLPQMESFRLRWLPEQINEGAAWMALGFFFKCCLADNLAPYISRASVDNPFLIWLANLVFGLRIYFDFSGYSLIALGLAKCFGVRLTLNFASPYCATSIVEFWRRWHITLSQWFRDYIYVPLGGGRVRFWVFNVLLVFIVSGVWHGAGWNFLLWGALHGAFLIVNRLAAKVSLPKFISWGLMMTAVLFAWTCFYELNTSVLMVKLKTLLTPTDYSLANFKAALQFWPGGDLLVMVFFLALAFLTILIEWFSLRQKNEPYHHLRTQWVLIVLVILTVWLAPGKDNGFIYFAF